MEYHVWEGYYGEIVRDFGFSMEKDIESGRVLANLLKGHEIIDSDFLKAIISGKGALIVGPLADEIPEKDVIIGTDLSTALLLERGILPDIIVTDLDGDLEAEIEANAEGSVALIHAHGDNIEALKKYLPEFRGKIGGTVQTRPFHPLMNFGGFTDGDRAVFLAESAGAEKIYITGFDFERPLPKKGKDVEIKRKKLVWAKALISLLDVTYL